ncbi:WhiB family transcriptional regulator [Geodermatophilus sp. SYSU D00691]
MCQTADPSAGGPTAAGATASRSGYRSRSANAARPRAACLEYAVAAEVSGGIWGGVLPAERKTLPRVGHRAPAA